MDHTRNQMVTHLGCARTNWRYPHARRHLLSRPQTPMGLHLNYELRLADNTSTKEVDRVLALLRAHAAMLPFDMVSEVKVLDNHGNTDQHPDPDTGWLKRWAQLVATPYPEDAPPMTGDVATARGFHVHPGIGCESATFGFMHRADETGAHREWYWYCQCKTQYASTVSDAHLIKCHLCLVSVLDYAITQGVDVVVRDEAHYWNTRDEQVLIFETAKMNRIVAAVAGRFADGLGEEPAVEAPIFVRTP